MIYVIPGYVVSGVLRYDISSYVLDSVWVYLHSNGVITDSTQADVNGYYQFNTVQNGTYTITGKTHKPWGGVNATDAEKVKLHFKSILKQIVLIKY